VNAKTDDNNTALHMAASWGYEEIVELLVAKGADVNARGSGWYRRTPLHYAVFSEEVIALLIAGGADVNARDRKGRTPLHLAAQAGEAEAVRLLIAAGADINAEDDSEYTPLDRAETWGGERAKAAEVLRKAGAKE